MNGCRSRAIAGRERAMFSPSCGRHPAENFFKRRTSSSSSSSFPQKSHFDAVSNPRLQHPAAVTSSACSAFLESSLSERSVGRLPFVMSQRVRRTPPASFATAPVRFELQGHGTTNKASVLPKFYLKKLSTNRGLNTLLSRATCGFLLHHESGWPQYGALKTRQ